MHLVGERSPLSHGSSRCANKLVVTLNKAVVVAKFGSTLRMASALKDESMDFNNKAGWSWLPLGNNMEALWRRERQGIVGDLMQIPSHEVGSPYALTHALLYDCTANSPAPAAWKIAKPSLILLTISQVSQVPEDTLFPTIASLIMYRPQ
jgi:hypothetical protein